MFRPIPLIVFASIAVAQQVLPEEAEGSGIGIFVWLCIVPVFFVLFTAVANARAQRRAQHSLQSQIQMMASLVMVISWCVAMFFMAWMQFVRSHIGNLVLIDELVVILPLILSLAAIWFVTGPKQSRLAWVSHRLRLDFLILCIPIMLLWSLHEATEMLGYSAYLPYVEIVGLLGILILSPYLVTHILSTRSLVNQDIRQSVFDIARRAGIKLHDVREWNTHMRLMNAMAIGFIPLGRAVLLSDRLIANLTRRELHAVIAHETAHHRCKHLFFLVLTVFGILLWSDWLIAEVFMQEESVLLIGIELLITFSAIVVVLRKFERQADVYAAVDQSRSQGSAVITPDAAMAMSDALASIAWVHNIPVQKNELMHGSIESRQLYITSLIGQPFDGLQINTFVFRLKMCIIIIFTTAIIL